MLQSQYFQVKLVYYWLDLVLGKDPDRQKNESRIRTQIGIPTLPIKNNIILILCTWIYQDYTVDS
jgi:hypothetical protein